MMDDIEYTETRGEDGCNYFGDQWQLSLEYGMTKKDFRIIKRILKKFSEMTDENINVNKE